MRIFAIFLLSVTACRAQSEEAKVESVLKNMERAEQAGDFNAWQALWTRPKAAELEGMRAYVKPRPEVRYRTIRSFVRGDNAVLLVEGTPHTFITFKLSREGSDWKLRDAVWRETAPNPNSVYALAPPPPGAFARAGSPWDKVAAGLNASEAARQGWQLKAIFDEAYLYIRLESDTELPAPGSTIAKPVGGWPVLKITTSDAGEFVLFDAVNIGDKATFDAQGKANSHRAFAAYMIRLEQKDKEVFSATAGLEPSPLLDVAGRNYEIRIPLAAMGITDSRASKITVGDAQWPKSVLVSLAAQRYPQ